ncbi:amidase domain-containing protein [Sulfobacillus sp. hq2]|uniref:amidase domain-containing protein n=1 Tax=Sulfobacillus TaxID=28033 RepID=UPI000CD29488|nr:amidase domain-containing protein [Sulfobacillus sp. hq2]POB10172.1 hypothetical protein CO251_11410 [Sulfobacillus sp. hq2]
MNTHFLSASLIIINAATFSPHFSAYQPAPLTPPEQAVKSALQHLVTQEDHAILTHNRQALEQVFTPQAHAALHEATKREAYLSAWAKSRQIAFKRVTVSLRTPGIQFRTNGLVHVFAIVSERYQVQKGTLSDAFGLGIRHDYVLQSLHGQWRIASDDFTDPLNQDTHIPGPVRPADDFTPHYQAPSVRSHNLAVDYANRYCGAAPGCGNGGRYNSHYIDYNGDGGDCTNFISQALAAAGFRQTPVWEYSARLGEGSPAWANAARFKYFLESTGRATLMAQGRYSQLTQPTKRFPHGAVNNLVSGDLISYIEHGRTVHTAIVVGTDRLGYLVVDTHTADRYHVPWDLGWDRHTVYDFWHVHYPSPNPHASS